MKPRLKKSTSSKADDVSLESPKKGKKPKKRTDKTETEPRNSMDRPNLHSLSDPQKRFSSDQKNIRKSGDSFSQGGYSIWKDLFTLKLIDALMKASQRGYTLWNEEDEDSSSSGSESSDESFPEVPETEVSMDFELPKDIEGPDVREYIEDTVGEPLLLAMATLERERPDNPIEFIAEYLLHFKVQAEEEKGRIDKETRKSSNPLKAYTQIVREDRL